jgi:hypothetical protein
VDEFDGFDEVLCKSELEFLIALITKRSAESDYGRLPNLDIAGGLGD